MGYVPIPATAVSALVPLFLRCQHPAFFRRLYGREVQRIRAALDQSLVFCLVECLQPVHRVGVLEFHGRHLQQGPEPAAFWCDLRRRQHRCASGPARDQRAGHSDRFRKSAAIVGAAAAVLGLLRAPPEGLGEPGGIGQSVNAGAWIRRTNQRLRENSSAAAPGPDCA